MNNTYEDLRRLEDVLQIRLEDVLKTSRKTSWRRLGRQKIVTLKTSSRRLGRRKIVTLKTCWRRLQDMSWRRLEDQQMFSGKRLVILSVHDVRNQSINEQKCAVLARCVSSILYLYKKRAEMQFQSMNISLLHMYQVYLPLYQNCIDSGVLISLNAMWNIRKEVD